MQGLMGTVASRWSSAVWLAPILLAVHAAGFWGRGLVDKEGLAFVLNYLADRPLTAIIFDPSLNDWGAYQARELSYLVDYFDAQALASLYSWGILLFVPVSGVLGLAAIVVVYVSGARRLLRLDQITTAFLLSWFLSTIVVQSSTAIFYRSAKILLTVLLLLFLLEILSLLRSHREQGPPVWAFTKLFLLGLGMSLADRQGFFFLLLFLSMFVLWFVVSPPSSRPARRTSIAIGGVLLAAIISESLYNQVVAPRLIFSLNGYHPDFSFQRLELQGLWEPSLWRQAGRMIRRQAGFLLGGLPFWGGAGLAIGFYWHAATQEGRGAWRPRQLVRDTVLVVAVVGGLLLMTALMILRHPPIYTIPDHSYWYNFLPAHVLFLFGASLLLMRLDVKQFAWRVGLWLVIGIMVAGNIRRYPEQRAVMVESSWLSYQVARTERILAGYDQLASNDADSKNVPRWVSAERFGGRLRLPVVPEDFFPDSLEAALATRSGKHPLLQASGPQWPSLRSFFARDTSPLDYRTQIAPALKAWREAGIREVVVEPGRYEDLQLGRRTVQALRAATDQVIGEASRGPLVRFVLADAAPPFREIAKIRRVPSATFTLNASHTEDRLQYLVDGDVNTDWLTGGRQQGGEWISVTFDRSRDVARLRLDLHRRAFGDYPRELRIESRGAKRRAVLYEGSGLPPLVRGVMRNNFVRSAIEIDFPPNQTDVLLIQQTEKSMERPWSVHELSVWER